MDSSCTKIEKATVKNDGLNVGKSGTESEKEYYCFCAESNYVSF